ncbi:TetR/AcrR family transcriptional regulator [Actinopolymorpha singaporensis]|uniref:DNA-binding transcriptional regulator, AcrR family n=1 Tax=Actinopolymorpha singaporensis TaxID=117157 RepID=A0A1H1M7S4_9ACTN|nr:TetR/AcrR family transcriptional regulator [Actinopolymorpha singaporensis]SDR82776.1 DNA-binding transcriptional regulator, AcrR family [Actinopolymorpha singaporensis]
MSAARNPEAGPPGEAGRPRPSRAERRRQTEERILASARREFAERGYERTTIRGVAGAAGVDPALVMQYFGSKDQLFRQAVHVPAGEELPAEPAEFAELLLSILGVKLSGQAATMPLLRSAFTHPEATEAVRASLAAQIAQGARAIPADDPELRSALLVAVLLGVTTGRHLLELDHLRDASPEQITDLLRPAFQALIRGSSEPDA